MNDKLNVTLEHKQWVRITDLCNNSCVFCLDARKQSKPLGFVPEEKVKQLILQGKKDGAVRLVLSGGDPTVDPKLAEYIRYGKSLGYTKVQIITNGRKLSYKHYLNSLKQAGLDEVTFSLHGHTAALHDRCTRVPGSFSQIVGGIKNALSEGLIVNTDTVISKINYRHLADIVRFAYGLGVREANLMSLVPVGNADEYHQQVFYDMKKVVPYVYAAIEFARAHGMHFWLSRFPPKYLRGYEEYISPTKKIYEDIAQFDHAVHCKEHACVYCSLQPICTYLKKYKKRPNVPYKGLVLVSRAQLADKLSLPARAVIKIAVDDIERIPTMEEVVSAAVKTGRTGVQFANIPPCKYQDVSRYTSRDYFKNKAWKALVREIALYAQIKPESCTRCRYDPLCRGIPQNYVVKYGFKGFLPVSGRKVKQ
jgi:MoaA/NifB/PqqE/SkfB family radical SAM enzyme